MLRVAVVGATGATGKHVVQQLLDQGHSVQAIVRSKENLLSLVNTTDTTDKNLQTTEAAILDIPDAELANRLRDVDAVVTCLGHNPTVDGVWGEPRRLVSDAVGKITKALQESPSSEDKPKKLVLMGSVLVDNPAGSDNRRRLWERAFLRFLRVAIPPHSDNELAAERLHQLGTKAGLEWAVLRPTDLMDEEVSDYELYDKPEHAIFATPPCTRANVAKSMVDLLTHDDLWQRYKFQMPVICNRKSEPTDQ